MLSSKGMASTPEPALGGGFLWEGNFKCSWTWRCRSWGLETDPTPKFLVLWEVIIHWSFVSCSSLVSGDCTNTWEMKCHWRTEADREAFINRKLACFSIIRATRQSCIPKILDLSTPIILALARNIFESWGIFFSIFNNAYLITERNLEGYLKLIGSTQKILETSFDASSRFQVELRIMGRLYEFLECIFILLCNSNIRIF